MRTGKIARGEQSVNPCDKAAMNYDWSVNLKDQLTFFISTLVEGWKIFLKIPQKALGAWIFIFILPQFFIQILLAFATFSPSEDSSFIFNFGNALASYGESFLLLLLIPHVETFNKLSLTGYLALLRKFGYTLIAEGLRMISHILLWSLLLLIPGLYKQIRWIFVPFIVQLSPSFQRGELDPLVGSQQLSGPAFLGIVALFAANFIIEAYLDSFLLNYQAIPTSLAYFSSGILTLSVSTYTFCVLFAMYIKAYKNLEGEESYGINV